MKGIGHEALASFARFELEGGSHLKHVIKPGVDFRGKSGGDDEMFHGGGSVVV
jgi:hypothetical protein